MQLHRATGNDWDSLTPSDRNIWQRFASRTNGVLTPGNVISLVGASLVAAGLVLMAKHTQILLAVALLIIGRVADLADGFAADATGTKSPLGEAVDASIDKSEIAAAVIVLWLTNLIPTLLFILFAVHALYNTGLLIVAKSRGGRLHPTRTGKLAVALQWVILPLFVIHAGLSLRQNIEAYLIYVAWALLAGFIVLAILSGLQYSRQLVTNEK